MICHIVSSDDRVHKNYLCFSVNDGSARSVVGVVARRAGIPLISIQRLEVFALRIMSLSNFLLAYSRG